MTISIRPADLVTDRPALIRAIVRDLNPKADDRRFEWMYLDNPAGPARVWVAEDRETGEMIGMASAFPRRLEYQGLELSGWVLGDFAIAERHRALGPAVQLQRAIVAGVESGMADLFYDFPSHAMIAVYKRLGIPVSGEITRFAKPLRCDRFLRERVPYSCVARPLSGIGNFVLSLCDRARAAKAAFSIERIDEKDIGSACASMWGYANARYGMTVKRTDEYLRWRYMQAPGGNYEMIVARRHRTILGYAVVNKDVPACSLVDCVTAEERSIAAGLIGFLSEELRMLGKEALSVSTPPGTWWARDLEQLGFYPRETSPFVAYLSRNTKERLGNPPSILWIVMSGDRDC